MNVSIVSDSRVAGPPQLGQVALRNPSCDFSGDSPVGRKATSVGSTTGRFSSGSGTTPQRSQKRMGMGVPQ